MTDVGFPRIERNANGEPIINIGPYGGMAMYAAMMYEYLPRQWPPDWPQDGVISMDDPRVGAACGVSQDIPSERELLYYYERRLDG